MNKNKASVTVQLDDAAFSLKRPADFSWLSSIGRVFQVFSQNDSGNISFGVDTGKEKLFIKVAGLETLESVCTPQEAVENLKAAMEVYEDIRHPALIRLRRHYPVGNLYVAEFGWAEGECLHDHWNFDYYEAHPEVVPPARRFKELPVEKRLEACRTLFSFLEETARAGYVAVDLYDASILYDFNRDRTTICDIDLFRKAPLVNTAGEGYYGSERFKAPEEYILGAAVDERTNVFTLGALLFSFFGDFTPAERQRCYEEKRFVPCRQSAWELSSAAYRAACRAVSPSPAERFASIVAFSAGWEEAVRQGT